MAANVFTVERHGYVAAVWMDRPDKLNAMGPAFWEELPALMHELGEDEGVRAVVIAGRGPAFTVGIDLEAFEPLLVGDDEGARGRQELYATIKRMQRTFTAVAECPVPVIAAIHGYCIGGGIDLITACDIRLAARDAVFSVRETKMAIVADVGTLQRLPEIIDPGRVAELVYTGRDLDAAEAVEMGLVSHLYEDRDALLKAAGELAGEIAANSPLAVRGAKAVLAARRRAALADQLDYVALWNAAFLRSHDLSEALEAFVERRPPHFTGE